MNGTSRNAFLGCTLAAGMAALPVLAGAQAQPTARTYVVTMISQSAQGNTVMHEGLALERDGDAARLQLASPDGSVLSRSVTFTSQGEIALNAQDAAITCYNMAMNALARERDPAGEPAAVFVRFGNSVVRVPLNTLAAQTHGGERAFALQGRSSGVYSSGDSGIDAGIIINAAVTEEAGDLHAATFDELHYIGSPANVVERSTCILQRTKTPATRA